MRPFQLTIPCFNESLRLDAAKVERLVHEPELGVVLVDDGSTDDTLARLRSIAERHPEAVQALSMPKNAGKGEVVRAGMLHSIANGARVVGYADADFSTPPEEVLRLLHVLQSGQLDGVLASRFARLGAHIERKRSRHYLGRVFATFAAAALDLVVYDTQCGAKWFRVTNPLRHALEQPFLTRWVFDVELLGRLIGRFGTQAETAKIDSISEEPLLLWRDVAGSKLSVVAMARAFVDLLRLWSTARK